MTRVAGVPVSVITLTYTVPEDEVDRHMKAHIAWLQAGFAEGAFLLAGRQVPRTGGIIVCRGTKAEVEAVAATDPFVTEGVATATVVEMAASFAHEVLAPVLR